MTFMTIRARILLLIALIMVPLMVADIAVFFYLKSLQSDAQEKMLGATSRALAAAVDAELAKYIAVGYSLGSSELLRDRKFEQFHAQALVALAKLPGSWVVVANADGQQLLNTLRRYGDPLPMVQPLDAHFRALVTRTEQIGD